MCNRVNTGRDREQPWAGLKPLLLVALLLAPAGQTLGQKGVERPADNFSRLVRIVAAADQDAQQDFAWIALSELVAAYEKVYASSATERPKKQKAREKLYSWRSATRSYVAELYRLLERLSAGADIQIQAEEAGPPVIHINGTPVIISGPEIGSVMLMEKRIIDTYCDMYDCSDLATAVERQAEMEPRISAGSGSWTLQNFGRASYRTKDGLIFLFSGLSERDEKQRACDEIAAELRSLSAGLQDAALAGHWIEWESIDIQPLARELGERVRFNSAQEYLLLPLPLLAQSWPPAPGILNWLRQRAFDGTAEVEIVADPLLRRLGVIQDQR